MTYQIAIEKAGTTYEVDYDAFPEVSRQRIIIAGISKLLSEAANSVSTHDDIDGRRIPKVGKDLAAAQIAAKELVDRRLSDLFEGILRRVRSSSIDPVDAEARQIAIKLVRQDKEFLALCKKNGWKPTQKEAVEELTLRASKRVSEPGIIALARKRVAEMDELAALA